MEEGREIREVSRAAYAVIKTGYTESDGRCHASLERVALRDGAVGWAVHFRPGHHQLAYDMWRCYGGDGSVARLDDWQQSVVFCNRKLKYVG